MINIPTLRNLLQLRPLLRISGTVIILLMVLFGLRLCQLQERADDEEEQRKALCSAEQRAQNPESCPKTETHDLFDKLMAQDGLVGVNADKSLTLPQSDYLLSRRFKKETVADSVRILLERLQKSIAGKSLQQQVQAWNHSRKFAAIRDSFPSHGNNESRWQALDNWDSPLPGNDTVPLDFGYVNAGALPVGFNDWLSISGQDEVLFKTTVRPAKQSTFTLNIIGQPDISALPGKKVLSACQYDAAKHTSQCQEVAAAIPEASVYRLVVTLPAGQEATLNVRVKPAVNVAKMVDGLPIQLAEDGRPMWNSSYEYQRSAGTVAAAAGREQFRFNLKTADGKLLFDSLERYPTAFTRDFGLLSLVGYDATDRLALAGLISKAKLPRDNTDVRLTLDSRLQTLAYQSLQAELKQVDPNKQYANERRAAVVFIDPQTGAILAAANDPNPPDKVHRWDRLSFSKLYPTRDPFGVSAWQGLDNNNTPGSVFKLVTALAGLQSAEEGRDDLRAMLRGLSASEFEQRTGLPISSSSYQPDPEKTSLVSNSEGETLAAALPYRAKDGSTVYPALRTSQGESCPAQPERSHNLGLREAVRDSLNIWFARLGVMMDENHLESGGKDTDLAKMANTLGFGKKLAIAPIGSPLNPKGGLDKVAGRGSVLTAATGSLTIENQSEGPYAPGSALQRLTQNSFGQGVSTTPLQMARVAATIATGYLPQPYLLGQWDGSKMSTAQGDRVEPDEIELLRQGMKAVPETGTAANAFAKAYPNGRCRVYGKTGTAQVAGGQQAKDRFNFNTGWFVGWRENKEGKPDLAFACMVTHTYLTGHRYGGDVCAPIVARVLNGLDQPIPTPKEKR